MRIQGEDIEVKARIRQFDMYSGHADAGELAVWVRARLPISHAAFLTHGEEAGLTGLRERLSVFIDRDRLILPWIDDAFDLGPKGPRQIDLNKPKRLSPNKVARLDWHNDLSKLLLNVSHAVNSAADERGRAAIIRRVQRALDERRT